jgi:lipoprotein-anchoring transpeptidase ErfK/SrfK
LRSWSFVFVPAFALLALEACDKARHDPSAASDAATTAAEVDGATAASRSGEDGGATTKAAARRLVLKLAAASFVASVSDAPDWPENDAGAKRLGYLRNGAIVSAYDPPLKNEECKDGWYELVEGGYVCGKAATIDLTNPRVKLAPKQPDLDAGMPYRYGVNVSDGTPVYRRVLNAEDRRKFEPHLGAAAKPEESSEADKSAGAAEKAAAQDEEPPLATTEDEPPPPRRHSRTRDHERGHDRDHHDRDRNKDPFRSDAGRPMLKELKGRGVLVRKMARGFTVALDRDFKAANTRWWRSTFGFAVPFDRIAVQGGVAKHTGNWFRGEGATAELLPFPELALPAEAADAAAPVVSLPLDAGARELATGTVGFVTTSGARKLDLTEDGKGGFKVGWGVELPKKSAVLLTGREQTVGGVVYHQTSGGFWVRLAELKIARPSFPTDLSANEKWIDVDLTRQQLVAFEGRRPVFATLISSGRRNPQDKEHDFPTPPGSYRIREKHVTTTMDGDVASDGPYSIEDVPWVMYFQGSYALHGAFWHDSFGNMRSHGCVNLSPEDARTLFGWTDPPLPPGWHGVFSKDDNSGSRVIVHEDPRELPKRR